MAFRLPRGGRLPGGDKREQRAWTEDQVIWGVPRRAGHDDHDDPKAHAGLAQHAFEPGNDERAICGFEPAKRASGPSAKPRPQLAMPSPRLNPRCSKCVRLISRPEPAAPEPPAETAAPAPPPEPPPPAQPARPAAELSPPTQPTLPLPIAPPDPAATVAIEPPLGPANGPVPSTPSPPPVPPPAPADGWAGTVTFDVGGQIAIVRPPSQPGLGVVASVVSGPSGTRVASVTVTADGMAVISLGEPARGPVTVAWFVVPAVDGGNDPEVRSG